MSLFRLQETFSVRGDLHHACLLTGDRASVCDDLFTFLESDMDIVKQGNPDFHFYEYETFGIDDGRKLQGYAVQKPIGEVKVFVAVFDSMTREAQNALLKLFEDPKEKTHFFLITENTESILPTLLSRLFVIEMQQEMEKSLKQYDAKKFMKLSKAERLEQVKELLEEKNKRNIFNFLGALETYLYSQMKKKGKEGDSTKGLKEIEKAKQYVFDRSSSLKLLLEHVALTVPQL